MIIKFLSPSIVFAFPQASFVAHTWEPSDLPWTPHLSLGRWIIITQRVDVYSCVKVGGWFSGSACFLLTIILSREKELMLKVSYCKPASCFVGLLAGNADRPTKKICRCETSFDVSGSRSGQWLEPSTPPQVSSHQFLWVSKILNRGKKWPVRHLINKWFQLSSWP